MTHFRIDINVDMGEGIGNESQLMPYISSCNIACGGHAGNIETMTEVVKLAKQYRVKIGAHPSFPDKENFGRKPIEMYAAELFSTIRNQINTLISVLDNENAVLNHIKPHGALYNLAAIDEKIAHVIIEVMKSVAMPLKLYVPYKSVIAGLAIKHHVPIIFEAFADRNYNDDLSLVSRQSKNALINDYDDVFEHVYRMITTQKVNTIQGKETNIFAETFCVHGDNLEAVNLVKYLKEHLEGKGIIIL